MSRLTSACACAGRRQVPVHHGQQRHESAWLGEQQPHGGLLDHLSQQRVPKRRSHEAELDFSRWPYMSGCECKSFFPN
jgi:hypothetical protein